MALDTSYILGRGAVKDTYNLLGDGIVKLVKTLADLAHQTPQTWVKSQLPELGRYFDGSLKGSAGIDWEDQPSRQAFLTGLVADADRLLEMASQKLVNYDSQSAEHKGLKEVADLLGQLLLQDVERSAERASIKEGTAKDRVISVEDPEMRHGHKSATKLFDGHKAALAVDAESQLITAVDVLPGNASDCEGALELVKQSEANTEAEVEETLGDCAYGAGATHQEFADAGRRLVAKVPPRPNGAYFAKQAFRIDPAAKTCACPAGNLCSTLVKMSGVRGREGKAREAWGFSFAQEVCASCPWMELRFHPLRPQCVKAKSGQGRTVSLHPQEALLQEARAFQGSDAFQPYRRWRQTAERRIARLMQLGMRQARYFGRAKTKGQLLLAAMVANLTLAARGVGLMRRPQQASAI